jgi:hypothetical protein
VTAAVALGQSFSGSATTKSSCSPANTGNNNTFNITCQGISDKLGAQLIDLLNRVARNQLDAEAVMSKIDGCLEGVREVGEQQATRHLTEGQKATLLSTILPFRGSRVTIAATEGDPEAYAYAQDFVTLFRQAGFNLVAFAGNASETGINGMTIMGGPPVTGLVLHPTDENEWRKSIFAAFDRALIVAGVQHTARYIGKMRVKETDLEFFVGVKPRE